MNGDRLVFWWASVVSVVSLVGVGISLALQHWGWMLVWFVGVVVYAAIAWAWSSQRG